MLAKNYKDEEDRLNNHTKGKKSENFAVDWFVMMKKK